MKQHQRSGVLCKTHNTKAYSVKNVANLESKLKSVGYVLVLQELSEKFQLKKNLRIRFLERYQPRNSIVLCNMQLPALLILTSGSSQIHDN